MTFHRNKDWVKNSTLLSTALLLFSIAALAYLLQLRGWGFYKDDWHLIWTGSTLGTSGIIQLFTIDRPFMGVLYAFTYRFLGENPFAWQLFGLSVRVLGMYAFWWVARLVWPGRERLTTFMALIFIVYPGFLQQPNANTFQNHFIGYGAAILSIAFSLKVLRMQNPTLRFLLTGSAVALALFYWMIYE